MSYPCSECMAGTMHGPEECICDDEEDLGLDPNKPYDQQVGVYRKYYVERLNDEQGKHKHCDYFVLDPRHDPFAIEALRAYAKACKDEYPLLANDLERWAIQAWFERTQKAIAEDQGQ